MMRKEMIDYLSNHFRYDTMRSWNCSTSYAHCIKIHKMGFDKETLGKLWELKDCEGFCEQLFFLIADFNKEHDYQWQAGVNGRSDGYIVLFQGGKEPSGYKSYCPACGQLNYREATEESNICGRCLKPGRKNFIKAHMRVYSIPGRGTDMYEDFEEWSDWQLEERIKVVKRFEQLYQDIKAAYCHLAGNYVATTETCTVTKTRKVLGEAI